MDDVIKAIGEANYFPGANDVYKTADGHYCGTPIGNTAADMLWLRKDLMQKAGIDKAPETWDELRDAAKKMQTGGIYGAPLPYGLNSMTSLIFIGFIHRAGGQIFTKDLDIALDSDGTYKALDFYKSMREFCPPGATNYSWGESLTAFVSGATATGIYAGRVLANVNAQNPDIADSVTCAVYPTISKDVKPWTFNDFPSVFIPKDASNMDVTKKFAAFLFEAKGYIPQLHAAPGHVLPVLKTIAEDPAYLDNPIIKKYPKEVELMSQAAAAGKNLGYEEDGWKANVKANDIIGSNTIAELVQRVVLNGEDAKATVKEIAGKIEAIMKA
jgi:multiple sugar transport system substrate-binding protein